MRLNRLLLLELLQFGLRHQVGRLQQRSAVAGGAAAEPAHDRRLLR
ncbi:MAG: hypothetical protein M0038_19105 [Pseudomonadota bacterium]|nr:hypothetical protein [Pseudomonadota bacterium]